MEGWPTTLAWVITVVSLSVPVLYFLGAMVVGIRRLFSRGVESS